MYVLLLLGAVLQEDADDILADNAEDLGGEDLGGSAAHYRYGGGPSRCKTLLPVGFVRWQHNRKSSGHTAAHTGQLCPPAWMGFADNGFGHHNIRMLDHP